MKLRDYQESAIREIKDAFFQRKLNRLLVVHPTGSGKTVLFANLLIDPDIQEWVSSFEVHRRKTLVIAHREELLDQATDTICRVMPDALVETERAEKRATDSADVVVASIASLTARNRARLNRLGPERFRVVIVDEAHHTPAPSYLNVLRELGGLPSELGTGRPDVLTLGVTATADRADQLALGAVFDEIVDSRSIRELIDRGVLSPLRAFRILTQVSLDHVRLMAGDFNVRELSKAVNLEARSLAAVKAYQEHCAGRQAIAFGVDVQHSSDLAKAFIRAGITAGVVHGDMTPSERAAVVGSFRRRELRVLANCMVLTEGFDAPDVSCIIQARPTQSRLLYMQMIGRGARRAEGKDDCIVLDLVDNWAKHSVVTIASLFGLPPRFAFNGEYVTEVAEKYQALESLFDGTPPLTLDDINVLATPVPLWNPDDPEKSWIESAPGIYQLLLGGASQERVVIRPRPAGWQIQLRRPEFKVDGAVVQHVNRFEVSREPWPPLEFERMYPTASAARAAVEGAALRRERVRSQHRDRRTARARQRPDLFELAEQARSESIRIDRLISSRFSAISSAVSRKRRNPTQRPSTPLRRFRFEEDTCLIYRCATVVRPIAAIRCDGDGCDVFRLPDLPADDRDSLQKVLDGLQKFLSGDAKESHHEVAAVVRSQLSRWGWETFVQEAAEILEGEQQKA